MKHKIKITILTKPNKFHYVFLFLILSLFPGCLLDRLMELKRQACVFDKHFTVITEPGGGLSLVASHPVLLDKDINWLTGVDPSDKQETSEGLDFLYMFRKQDTPYGGTHLKIGENGTGESGCKQNRGQLVEKGSIH